jgi:hypothetical protein
MNINTDAIAATQAKMPAIPSAIMPVAAESFFFTFLPKADTGWVVSVTNREWSVPPRRRKGKDAPIGTSNIEWVWLIALYP